MGHLFKVHGHTLREHGGRTPSVRTDFEIVVAFEKLEDNHETLKNFVRWYRKTDLEDPHNRRHVLNPENCACALATFHFREKSMRFHDDQIAFASALPSQTPTEETPSHRLWIMSETSKEVYTAQNAGWDLYLKCEDRKISVEEGRAFVYAKVPDPDFTWHDVLGAFRKTGGRHTEQYLRRA